MEKIERNFGLCPVCGEGHIIKTNKDYVCTNKLKPSGNGKSCRFSLPLHLHGVEITDSIIHQLIQNGRTEELTLSDQRGFSYRGHLIIVKDKGYSVETKKITLNAVCPECGGDILVGTTAFNCSNYKHGCNFKIWKHYYGHKVNLQDAKELLSNGHLQKPFTAFDKYGHILALNLQLGSHNEIQIVSNK